MYPRAKSVKKTTLFSRKLNELSENVGFDSEFTLTFEIQPFRVAFFVYFGPKVVRKLPLISK